MFLEVKFWPFSYPTAGSWTLGSAFMIEKACAYPLKTPRTRFSTKNDPKMTRLTKYTQGNSNPIASFIWKK